MHAGVKATMLSISHQHICNHSDAFSHMFTAYHTYMQSYIYIHTYKQAHILHIPYIHANIHIRHTIHIYIPCNKEDFALLAHVLGNKIKVVDSVSTVIIREGCGEVVITLVTPAHLLHSYPLGPCIHLEDNVAKYLPTLQLQKLCLAFICHSHT